MEPTLFGSDLWKPALDKYSEVTGLTVELYGLGGRVVLASTNPTPLVALFREYGFEPGLFAESARRCLGQSVSRPAVLVDEFRGLTVIGTSLVLEGAIVGAAVAGYALARFSQVAEVQRWSKSAKVPFDRLWNIVRRQPPVPERRLLLNGELLQVLGDALLRENYHTRQYEEIVVRLKAASTAKDEFLAVLSHELRTPLGPILGWASVLKNNESPKVRQAAEAIARNVLLESRLIEDLLDVNQITRGVLRLDLEIHDLSALIHAALEMSAQDIEKKAIRLEFMEAGEPLFVEGDAVRLQQVFGNVISNAVKFTPDGGQIGITISREKDGAKVAVADSGVGIAPEFLPHVFDVFRQQEQGTRRQYPGLGIGLSLVKRLTELHNGTVSVDSAGPGQGTEVRVQLPLASAPSKLDASGVVGAKPPAQALAGLSILVVDDVQDARETLRALLQHAGADVLVARSGREALDMVQTSNIDLVLCDLGMPQMDGFEFNHELHRRASSSRLPVVAVSALASDADQRRTLEAGFEGHIKKPFDEAAVVAAVSAAVSHRHERQ